MHASISENQGMGRGTARVSSWAADASVPAGSAS